jgi:hypothetical protein
MILYTVDEDGILYVNPYGSIRKGTYHPVGTLPEKLQADLKRIIQEVQAKENEKKQRAKKKEK